MKTRILVVTVICAIAGLLGWFLNPPAADTKSADAKTATATADAKVSVKSEASKSAVAAPVATVAPVKPAQVAKPVAAAVKASANTPTPTTENFVAGPQTDLKTCVSTMMHFLETQDVLGLVKTIMPPDAINQMLQSGQASSIEDVAEHYRQMPDVAGKMSQMFQALQSVQGVEPEMSTDGTRATYKIPQQITGPGRPEAPAGTPGDITFVKIDGFWYLR